MKSKNSTPTLSVVLQYPDYFAFSIWDVTPSSVLEASQPNLPGKCDWAPSNAVGRDPAGSDGRSDCRSSDEAINRINRGLAAAKNGQRAHFGIRLWGQQLSNIKAKAATESGAFACESAWNIFELHPQHMFCFDHSQDLKRAKSKVLTGSPRATAGRWPETTSGGRRLLVTLTLSISTLAMYVHSQPFLCTLYAT